MQYIAETKEFQITEPTVVSIGKFDGLHVGHQKLVREMVRWKEKGLKVAMFTFSTPPLSLVGGRKQTVLMTNRERMELLRSAGVDYLVEYPFDQEVCHMAPEQFVKEILAGRMNARVIITGPDCHFGYKAAGKTGAGIWLPVFCGRKGTGYRRSHHQQHLCAEDAGGGRCEKGGPAPGL